MHHRLLRSTEPQRLLVVSMAGLLVASFGLSGEVRGQQTGNVEPATENQIVSPEDVIHGARQLIEGGKAEQAHALLQEAEERFPDHPGILATRAEALHELERTVEAVPLYERVVSLDPEGLNARMRLADFYLWTNQQDSALEHYLVALEQRPSDPALQKKVADILIAMDRTEEAIPYLESYLSTFPNDLETMRSLYQSYLWTDRPDRALVILEKMVELRPYNATLTRDLAERYVDLDKESQAIAVYERHLEIHTDDVQAHRALAQLYQWRSRPRDALRQYETYLALRPFDSEVRSVALTLSMDLGHGRRAKSHAGILGDVDSRYGDLARKTLLIDPGVGTALGTEYIWSNDNQGFNHHAWRIWGSVGVNEDVTLGAFYRFHWFHGADDMASPGQAEDVYGHQPGLFGTFKLPHEWILSWNMSVIKYHRFASWTSLVNTRLEARRTFGMVSLALFVAREDVHTWLGAVEDEVTENIAGMEIYIVPVERLYISLTGEYGWLNSSARLSDNHKIFGEASVGYVIFELPRFEAMYSYNIEHYTVNRTNSPGSPRNYFNPSAYQNHGPGLMFRHPVTTWFLYGLDLHLWHVVQDASLQLSYGAMVGFHPGLSHHLTVSFHRTDTIYGTTSSLYNNNILRAAYTYEF